MLPNQLVVKMSPGDIVFCNNNLLHRSVYEPESKSSIQQTSFFYRSPSSIHPSHYIVCMPVNIMDSLLIVDGPRVAQQTSSVFFARLPRHLRVRRFLKLLVNRFIHLHLDTTGTWTHKACHSSSSDLPPIHCEPPLWEQASRRPGDQSGHNVCIKVLRTCKSSCVKYSTGLGMTLRVEPSSK